MNMISEEVLALEPDIIAWRRHMHQNPELSFQEVHTTAYLTEELKKIPGLTLEFPTKTGVVAVLKGVQPGPVLALRADIDALPIQEETGLPYASTVPGVMHACGHDGHAAMQLAAAKLLAAERTRLKGEVRFLFQHAEELPPGGAVEMLKAGMMKGVDELYGMHLSSNFPTGTFGVRVSISGSSARAVTPRSQRPAWIPSSSPVRSWEPCRPWFPGVSRRWSLPWCPCA